MAEPVPDEDLLAFLREVAAGRRQFLKLEGDVDKLSAKEALMRGLPPRPPLETTPYRLWHRLATSALIMRGLPGTMPIVALRTGYNRLGLKGHMETSRNWSGSVISSPYRSKPFEFLIGTWTIPNFDVPAGGTKDEYACSTWIGFDGHRRKSNSLPQLGTVQQVARPGRSSPYERTVRAWWQWWHPGDTKGPVYDDFANLTVEIGHEIGAFMFAIPRVGVLMKMANFSTGEATPSILVPPPGPALEPRLLDAECILERPKSVPWPHINFMPPAFEATTFRCYAALQGETRFRTMRGGRLIRMVHSRDGEIRTIAAPDGSMSRSAVKVRYCSK
jgi:hypothetical protein